MTTVQQPSDRPTRSAPASPARPNGRWSGCAHLVSVRLKELQREPEVIFWVFGFPLLLALGLGIAFRSKPADVTSVAVVAGPGAQGVVSLIQGSPQRSSIRAEMLEREQAMRGFLVGRYDLVVEAATETLAVVVALTPTSSNCEGG